MALGKSHLRCINHALISCTWICRDYLQSVFRFDSLQTPGSCLSGATGWISIHHVPLEAGMGETSSPFYQARASCRSQWPSSTKHQSPQWRCPCRTAEQFTKKHIKTLPLSDLHLESIKSHIRVHTVYQNSSITKKYMALLSFTRISPFSDFSHHVFQWYNSHVCSLRLDQPTPSAFSAVKVKSTTDTSGVGTRKAIPVLWFVASNRRALDIKTKNTHPNFISENASNISITSKESGSLDRLHDFFTLVSFTKGSL